MKRETHHLCRLSCVGPCSDHALSRRVKGKLVDEVLTIKNSDIAKHLSLPPVKLHCRCVAAARAVIDKLHICLPLHESFAFNHHLADVMLSVLQHVSRGCHQGRS